MYPEPPRRSDSAKYSSSSLPKRPALPPIAFDEYRGSMGLPNFVVEPLPRESLATTGTIPPLSSYSPRGSFQTPYKNTITTGYGDGDQGPFRHPDGTKTMINLTNSSNNHPIPPKKDVSRLQKKNSKVSEPKRDFKTDVATCPKKESYLSIENNSPISVDDFMVKLLRLDGESSLDRDIFQDRMYSKDQALPLNSDGQKESIHEILKVSLLETEEPPQRIFYSPKIRDFDMQLQPSERKMSATAPPRGSSKVALIAKNDSSLNSASSSQDSGSRFTNVSNIGQKGDFKQDEYQNSGKSLPTPPQIFTQQESDYISDSESPNQSYNLEKSSTVNSASSNFDQISISGDSAQSIVTGTEGYTPTFQTLRRNKREKEESLQVNVLATPSDAAFLEMREAVKKSNNPTAQFDFAKYCIQLGDPYAEIGLSFLQKLAKSGFADAQFVLGQAYADDKRYDIALRYFAAATKRNNYDAAYEAGCLCENGGPGIKTNEREALNYYTKAGLAGHKKAMYRLALAELYGQLGLKRNINNGMKWLTRGEAVADKECPEPLYELSLIYEVGIYPVVISDSDHSFSLLKQAADLEYPPAQYKLGYCHEYGYLGVTIDKATSIQLYQISAKSGNKEAQLALSGWLTTGFEPIISRNDREALYWAHLSALQGLARAEYTMGYFLESGIGSTPNLSEASKWYKLASSKGDEMASKRLFELGSHLPKSPRKSKFKFF